MLKPGVWLPLVSGGRRHERPLYIIRSDGGQHECRLSSTLIDLPHRAVGLTVGRHAVRFLKAASACVVLTPRLPSICR